jgi:hypothetical protein
MRHFTQIYFVVFALMLAASPLAGQDNWRTPNGTVHLIRKVRDAAELNLPFQIMPISLRHSENMTGICEDGRGFLWLALANGAARFDGYEWTYFTSNPIDSTSILSDLVQWVKMDENGDPWFACEGGISHFLESTENFESFRHIDFFKGPGIGKAEVRMLEPDQNGHIWCGTTGRGLCRFDMKTKKFDCNLGKSVIDLIEPNENQLPISVHDIRIAKNGEIWAAAVQKLGFHTRLYRFDPKTAVWHRFTFSKVYTDKKSNLWQVPNDNLIWDIAQDCSDSIIFVHGPGAGLRSFNKNTLQWAQFFIDDHNDANSDVNNIGVNMECYTDSLLFIGRYDGVFVFIKNKNSMYRIYKIEENRTDGNQSGCLIFPNKMGDLWFSSQFALFKLENPNPTLPDSITRRPKIFIKSFLADGEQKIPHPTQKLSEIQLTEDCESVKISFYGLPFMVPNQLEYRYKLEKKGQNWVELGQNHEIQLDRLAGGAHQILIQVRRPNEGWSETTQISFSINIPFWKNPWFQWICALILGGAGFFFYRMKIREARQEAEFKRQIAEVEMTSLRAQMNPHFLFNCLAGINSLLQKNDRERASIYLTKFSRLVHLILENSKNDRISLHNDLDSLRLYLDMESLRFEPKLQFDIIVHPKIRMDDVYLPPLLIQPFVENAIWHGLMQKPQGGKVIIEYQPEGSNQLLISVLDNGIGRAKSAEISSRNALKNKSHGLQITNNRIRLLNDLHGTNTSVEIIDLYDESGVAMGTRVDLRISF